MKTSPLLAAAFAAAFTGSVCAQVQVIDSSPQGTSPAARSTSAPSAPIPVSNQQSDLFYQLQILQQEVMELRGLVEEQAFELKRLKQQRLDDYLNLDQRVSALTTGAAVSGTGAPGGSTLPASGASSINTSGSMASSTDTAGNGFGVAGGSVVTGTSGTASVTAVTPAPTVTDASEADVYGVAYELLKQRQIDASITAFKDHLQRYPRGEYASNSYYWLGEIYLLKDNLPEAQKWFGDLLAEFPDSRKVPDAQFKLGKVYHLQGNTAQARELLNIVASSNADASRLAQRYLQDNF